MQVGRLQSSTNAPQAWIKPIGLLERLGSSARLVAGGHSLLPMMKLRLANVEYLIDINDLHAELGYIRLTDDEVRIGAMTRHRELLESNVLAGVFPIFADAERVIADPVVRDSGTVLAAMAGGHEVRTVEGLADGAELDPIQEGFRQCHGLQCGFCTPGMLMTCRALLDRNPDPTEGEIREAISGQIRRCTGYSSIIRSVRWAAVHEASREEATAR